MVFVPKPRPPPPLPYPYRDMKVIALETTRITISYITIAVFEIKGAPCTLCAHFDRRVHRF